MRTWYFICIWLTIFIGFALLIVNRENDIKYNVATELHIIKDHLEDIKPLLVDFQQKHGRYPKNDEGLLALDNFLHRFKMRIALSDLVVFGQDYFAYLADDLYEKSQLTPEDVNNIQTEYLQHIKETWSENEPLREVELAVAKNLRPYILCDAGLISPSGIPYIYENRNGLDPAMFRYSPVNRFRSYKFSIKVDDNIFVYSPDGALYYREVFLFLLRQIVIAAVILIALVFFIYKFATAPKNKNVPLYMRIAKAIAGTFGILFSLYLLTVPTLTCYIMSIFSRHPNPKMLDESQKLLEKYHQAGVINDVTFARAKKVLEEQLRKQDK